MIRFLQLVVDAYVVLESSFSTVSFNSIEFHKTVL